MQFLPIFNNYFLHFNLHRLFRVKKKFKYKPIAYFKVLTNQKLCKTINYDKNCFLNTLTTIKQNTRLHNTAISWTEEEFICIHLFLIGLKDIFETFCSLLFVPILPNVR